MSAKSWIVGILGFCLVGCAGPDSPERTSSAAPSSTPAEVDAPEVIPPSTAGDPGAATLEPASADATEVETPTSPEPSVEEPSAIAEAADPADGSARKPAPPPGVLTPSKEYLETQRLYAEASQAFRAGRLATAEATLDTLLEKKPDHVQGAAQKAKLARNDGRYDEAIHTLDRVLEKRPKQTYILYEKALTLLEQEKPAETVECVLLILDEGVEMPAARYLRARALGMMRDREATLSALEDAVDHGFMDPDGLAVDEAFDFLKQDPAFVSVVRELRNAREFARSQRGPTATPPSEKPPEATNLPNFMDLREDLRLHLSAPQRAPVLEFEFPGLDDTPIRLADHVGKIVIVQFWGTWSRLSTRELAHLSRLRKEYRDQGVEVLTLCREINYAPDMPIEAMEEGAAATLRQVAPDLPCAVITQSDAAKLRVALYPTTIFVARDGRAYLWTSGYKDYALFEGLTRILLASGPPAPSIEPDGPGESTGKPDATPSEDATAGPSD